MTREEAITKLHWLKAELIKGTDLNEPIDMAIEALSADTVQGFRGGKIPPKEMRDGTVLIKVAVVRCKDCKWYKKIVEKSKSGLCHYDLVARCLHDEDYCSHGERREE